MQNKKDKGFTLVELLIVIVVLGILATVTVLAVSGITNRAKENSCAADRATLQTAYEAAYVLNSGAIPDLGEVQDALSANNDGKVAAAAANGVWGYTVSGTTATLVEPLDAPAGCEGLTLS